MMPFNAPQADPNKLIELRSLTIIAGEQKTSQKGKPYWRVKDSGGTEYAVFRSNIAERLDTATEPVPCAVEISVKGQYTNYAIVETDGAAQLMAAASPPASASAPAAPQNSAFSAPATPTPAKAPYNSELGAFQTALNGSVAIEAALITAKVAKEFNLSTVLDRAADFHRYLTTGKTDELDQFLSAAKEKMEAVEMPGPDAAPLPLDEPGDSDIPF
jgi:hypothetical protein